MHIAALETATPAFACKAEFYRELSTHLRGLIAGERDRIANAANMSALLAQWLADINWVGFYFLDEAGTELVVGPFQGKPACVRIAVGRGVCGTAVAERRSIMVPDVHAFAGHIACDAASRSELVVPVVSNGVIAGVLDIDSPKLSRFDAEDQGGIEALVGIFAEGTDL